MHEHDPEDPSGERFVPETMGGELIAAEHHARYRFALDAVRGKRVLDAGCGVGWGSLLIHQAGAASVVGLDISVEALADCRRRAPRCDFVEGNLEALPFDDADFDVVVCFEALEHAHDTARALDELVRVLRPDGLLFVSSPNPAVYPSGNPFHIHELTPAELEREVAARLPGLRLYRQHQALASILHPEVDDAAVAPFEIMAWPVAGLAPGNDPYAVAVATRGELPPLQPWACLAPFTQLQGLLDERAALFEQLHDADARLREAGETAHTLTRGRDEALETAAAYRTQGEAARVQLDNQRAVAASAARERDDLAHRLLVLQRQVASVPAPGEKRALVEVQRLRRRNRSLGKQLAIARETARRAQLRLSAIQSSTSWRATRPIRWAGRLAPGR